MKTYLYLGPLLLAFMIPKQLSAQQIKLSPGVALNFGEVITPNPASGGFFEINPVTLAGSANNAFQIGAFNVGSFSIEARPDLPIIITITPAAFVCDTTYLNPCIGTPTLTLTTNFPGSVPDDGSTICRNQNKCTLAVNVGGRFSFAPSVEGRWTNTLNIVVNYQ